jgi:queuine tRNA-ribosyltransferase
VYEDLRRLSAERVSAAAIDGLAIGGTLGRDKEEMREVVGMTTPLLDPGAPRHLLGIGEPDDLVEGISAGIDLFDCAVPTRLARHGMALAPLARARYRFDLRRARYAEDEAPLVEGCPCPTCEAHTRAYVHYLSRAEEMTAVRLLALHNLAYLEHLVRGAREAIGAGAFAGYRERILGGTPPWAALTAYGS